MTQPIPLTRPALARVFRNVGGEDGLARILRDFYRRMAGDVMIGFFFDGKDTDQIADQQRQFLMKAMGAAHSYSGEAPARAHDSLPPILAGHFDRRLRILEQTLADHGLGAEDIRTWVDFESAFRDQIVGS